MLIVRILESKFACFLLLQEKIYNNNNSNLFQTTKSPDLLVTLYFKNYISMEIKLIKSEKQIKVIKVQNHKIKNGIVMTLLLCLHT